MKVLLVNGSPHREGAGQQYGLPAESHRRSSCSRTRRRALDADALYQMNARPVERHPFEPFLPAGAKMLFLGSFPPQPHRWCMPFYYPNWINDFWRIMGLIHFGDKDHFCLTPEKRFDEQSIRQFCTDAGLAFYDTACEVRRLRDNASDAYLEVVTPTDIPAILGRIPKCQALITTGEKATSVVAERFRCPVPAVGEYVEIGMESIGSDSPDNVRRLRFWRMPSSSRAYPLPLERKAEMYRRLFI